MLNRIRGFFGSATPAMASTGEPAALPLELRDPDFIGDPWPTYDYLRKEEPVHRSASGAWLLTRFRDVHDALSDRRLGNSPATGAVVSPRNRGRYVCADVAANILPFMDAPAHTGPRKLITRAFHENLQTQHLDMTAMARSLLSPCLDSGEMDVLDDFATPLSLDVMMALLDLPASDLQALKEWSEAFFYLFAPMPSEQVRVAVDDALAEFRDYFLEKIRARRAQPGDDVISALVNVAGNELDDVLLADTCMLLFSDGIENVDAAIASAVLALLRHPRQLKWLRRHPEAMPDAIEECLRLEAPAQFLARVAVEDFELHGRRIHAGDPVFLVLGAANRDPAVYRQPERLDLRRRERAQIGFGRGRHSCIGARLAKQQMEAALSVLLADCASLSLTRAPLQWRDRTGHRWLKSLPVLLRPA